MSPPTACIRAFIQAPSMAARALLLTLLGALGGWSVSSTAMTVTQSEHSQAGANITEEHVAAARYISNLKTVVATRIVPGLQRGIASTAASRPRTLTIEVTDDPSPFSVGARSNPDGSLSVRVSLGYMTMHDAALDAAGVAAALNRQQELRKYFTYQLRIALDNSARRARLEPTERAMTFAEFAGLDSTMIRALFAHPDWRRRRDRVEIDSLGWVVAYFLVKADPRLAGISQSAAVRDGAGAARLAMSSGWFPVPPYPTAFGVSAIEQPAGSPPNAGTLLCRVARLMEAGLVVAYSNAQWGSPLEQEASLESNLAEIREQIDRMRRDGHCATSPVTASSACLPLPDFQDVRARPVTSMQTRGIATPLFSGERHSAVRRLLLGANPVWHDGRSAQQVASRGSAPARVPPRRAGTGPRPVDASRVARG